MKDSNLYKRAFNQTLTGMAPLPVGSPTASEADISSQAEISRTTARKILRELEQRGIIADRGASWLLLRTPDASDRFCDTETMAAAMQVEQHFIDWVRDERPGPGTSISCLKLATQFGLSTTVVREFLQRFERLQLLEYRANTGWIFRGYTHGFLIELFEVREMFERRAAGKFVLLPSCSFYWSRLEAVRTLHEDLLADPDFEFSAFLACDRALHDLVFEATHNRFADDFRRTLKTAFSIYSAPPTAKVYRSCALEHLEYIDALLGRDGHGAETIIAAHLTASLERMQTFLSHPRVHRVHEEAVATLA